MKICEFIMSKFITLKKNSDLMKSPGSPNPRRALCLKQRKQLVRDRERWHSFWKMKENQRRCTSAVDPEACNVSRECWTSREWALGLSGGRKSSRERGSFRDKRKSDESRG